MSPRTKVYTAPATAEPSSMDELLEDIRTLLAARRAEHTAAMSSIDDILTSITPKPRIGRPTKR